MRNNRPYQLESLEPRLLLSGDGLSGLAVAEGGGSPQAVEERVDPHAVAQATPPGLRLDYDPALAGADILGSIVAEPLSVPANDQAMEDPTGLPSRESSASGRTDVRTDESAIAANPGQTVYLDLDGATNIDYEGPVTLEGVSMAGFQAPTVLVGQEDAIVRVLQLSLEKMFKAKGVLFTLDLPPPGSEYSTVYIGEGSAFAGFGEIWGLAEGVDQGNRDHTDNGFVFSDRIGSLTDSAEDYGRKLAEVVAHEVGHLLGYHHAHTPPVESPLSDLGFAPYTHVEIAKDVRADVLEDGRLTIDGQEYVVHPKLVEAITNYPSYFYGGAVGLEAFPDLALGRSLEIWDTGVWVQRVLDMAWDAQNKAFIASADKLQILAFAYGLATHVAGEMFAHALVDEFSDPLDSDQANLVRQLLVEGYIADATPGFDHDDTRTLLPDGDISDDGTPGLELDVPTEFLYEALIKPFAGDPLAPADTGSVSLNINAATHSIIRITGSFVADGFVSGQVISASGFTANDGNYTVAGVTANILIVIETLKPGDALGSGDERLVAQGSRGAGLDSFIQLKTFVDAAAATAQLTLGAAPSADFDTLLAAVTANIEAGTTPTDHDLNELFLAYLLEWSDAIEDGMRHWGELGLAMAKAMFDPQTRRDYQNRQGDLLSPESDPARADLESGVELLDLILAVLDDPNLDGDFTDSFINNHLLPMYGLPAASFPDSEIPVRMDEVRVALQTYVETVADAISGPARMAFDPLSDAIDEQDPGRDRAEELVNQLLSARFGLKAEELERLLDLSFKMDLESATVNGETLSVFGAEDHETLDGYLGIIGVDPGEVLRAALQAGTGFAFHEDSLVDLGPNVEFDKSRFAAYADSVTFSKAILLLEAPVDGVALGAGQLSKLMADHLGAPYQWSRLNVNGNHGGNLLTTTLPKPTATVSVLAPDGTVSSQLSDSRPWLISVDRGAAWRADGGTGNFPLWESAVLRPVFRALFQDWQNGVSNFPALGDAASLDPNEVVGGITPSARIAALITPFDRPAPVTPATGVNLVVNGNQIRNYTSDVIITRIAGNGDAALDTLTVNAEGYEVRFAGNAGGGGLLHLTVHAARIVVDAGVIVFTRQIAPGANPMLALSLANSGNIIWTAETIEVGERASILAGATPGFVSGDVRFTASQSSDVSWEFGIDSASFQGAYAEASIEIGQDALLTGEDIQLTVQATTVRSAELLSDPDSLEDSGLRQEIKESELIEVSGFAAAVLAEASSRIVILDGARLLAHRDIVLDADAQAEAMVETRSSFLGFTYGSSSPTALIEVAPGAVLNANRDLTIEATAENVLDVTTLVPEQGDDSLLSISYGTARTLSLIKIRAGASLASENASITTRNTNSFSNMALAAGFPDSESLGFGAALVLGSYHSLAETNVSGDILVSGKLELVAESTNAQNVSRAYAQLADPLGSSSIRDALQSFLEGVGLDLDLDLSSFNSSGMSPELALATAVVVVESENRAASLVNDGARIQADSMTVTAGATDSFQVSATATAADAASIGFGGAVAWSRPANQATAFVGNNAIVDVMGLLQLTATATINNPIPAFDPEWSWFDTDTATGSSQFEEEFSDANEAARQIDEALEPLWDHLKLYLENAVGTGTSFVQSGGTAPTGGTLIGGGANLVNVYNLAATGIAAGARVNQRALIPNSNQDVLLDSTATLNLAGLAGLESGLNFIGADSTPDNTFGGYFSGLWVDNYALARIEDRAWVQAARDVRLETHTIENILQLVQAGAAADDVALDGAFALLVLGHESVASIEDRAVVEAGRDLELHSENSGIILNLAGSVAASQDVGVGAAAAVTVEGEARTLDEGAWEDAAWDGSSRTHAFIGDAWFEIGPLGTGGEVGSVAAGRNFALQADSNQQTWTLAVSGDSSVDFDPVVQTNAQSFDGFEFGVGLSGDAAYNDLRYSVQAFLRDVSVTEPVEELRIEASDSPLLIAAAGAVVHGEHDGIGGAFAQNGQQATVAAWTQDTELEAATLIVKATPVDTVLTFSVGASGEAANFSVAGSVNLNAVSNAAKAALGNRTTATATTIQLEALGTLNSISRAGASAAAVETFLTAGIALDLGSLGHAAYAFVGEDAIIDTPNDLEILAQTVERIVSVAASMALAGSGQENRVHLNQGVASLFSGRDGTALSGPDRLTTSVALGDLDGDDDLDLVTGNFGQFNRRYFNDGSGTFDDGHDIGGFFDAYAAYAESARLFHPDTWFQLPFSPSALIPDLTLAIALEDIDGDGDKDVIAGNLGQSNRLYLNDGLGGFTPGLEIGSETLTVQIFTSETSDHVTVDDLLTLIQERLDQALLAANAEAGEILVQLDEEGAMEFVSDRFTLESEEAERLLNAVRRDGLLETNEAGDPLVFTLVYDGASSDVSIDPDVTLNNVYAEDLLADLRACVDEDVGANTINVQFDATGRIVFALKNSNSHTLGDPSEAEDLIAAARRAGRIQLPGLLDAFLGPLTLEIEASESDTNRTVALAVGDIDQDGDPDFVTGNLNQANRLFVNDGDGHFGFGRKIGGDPDWTTSVVLANLNGDEYPDLVVGNVGLDLAGLIERHLIQAADVVNDTVVDIADLIINDLVELVDLVEKELVDRFSFDPLAPITLGDLVGLEEFNLAKLARRGIVTPNNFVNSDLDVSTLIASGIVTYDELNAAGLISGTGTVSMYSLTLAAAPLVHLHELIREGFVGVDDLAIFNITLGALSTTSIGDLVENGLLDYNDLIQYEIDLGTLLDSGLTSLSALVEAGLVDVEDVALDRLDLYSLLSGTSLPGLARIYINDKGGGFLDPVDLSADPLLIQSIAAGCIDDDDDVDLVVATAGEGTWRFLNNGDGTFDSGTELTGLGHITTEVLLADLDGDDDVDLVLANLESNSRIYLNDGSGNFDSGSNVGLESDATTAVAAGDLDCDGLLDLVTGVLEAIATAGSASHFDLVIDTRAYIDNRASVASDLSVRVAADDQTEVMVLTGAVGGGTNLAAGLAVANANIDRTVEAYVLGKVDAALGSGFPDAQGLEVTANVEEQLLGLAVGVAATGDVGLAAAAVVPVEKSHVKAYLDRGAQVTVRNATETVDLSVTIRAAHQTETLGYAGIGVGTLGSGLGAAVDAPILKKKTEAYIGSGAAVDVQNDLLVEATSEEVIDAVVTGLGHSQSTSVLGSASLAALDKSTWAYLSGGNARADGNVILSADSASVYEPRVGVLTVAGGLAIGVTATAFIKSDNTRAFLTDLAQVDALANQGATTVFTGNKNADDTRETQSARGVVLLATNADFLDPTVAATAAGGLAGNGSVSITLLDNHVAVYVDGGTKVNPDEDDAASAQLVWMLAWDDTFVLDSEETDAVALLGAVSATYDYAVLAKNTKAYISEEAVVDSKSDVSVQARSTEVFRVVAGSSEISLLATGDLIGGFLSTDVSTSAYIDERAQLTAAGAVSVHAISSSDVSLIAVYGGDSGRIELDLQGSLEVALAGTTEAFVDGTVTAAGLDVLASAVNLPDVRILLSGSGWVRLYLPSSLLDSVDPSDATQTESAPVTTSTAVDTSAGVGSAAEVTVTGDLGVKATSSNLPKTLIAAVGAAFFEWSKMMPMATVAGSTQAYVLEGATITALALDLKGEAESTAEVGATTVSGDTISVQRNSPVAVTMHDVAAFLGPEPGTNPNSDLAGAITVTGSEPITLQAISTNTAFVEEFDFTEAGADFDKLFPTIKANGSTAVSLGGSFTINGGGVVAQAVSSNSASTTVLSVVVTLIESEISEGEVSTDHATSAAIGDQADLNLPDGSLSLEATSTNEALMKETQYSGNNLFDYERVKVNVNVAGSTSAFIGEGAIVRAIGISVLAESDNAATINSLALDVSGIEIDNIQPSATVCHETEAYLGPAPKTGKNNSLHGTIYVTGTESLMVQATSVSAAEIGDLSGLGFSAFTWKKFAPVVAVKGSTLAQAGGNIGLDVEGVQLLADSTNTATTRTLGIVGTAISLDSDPSEVSTSHQTEASLATNADLAVNRILLAPGAGPILDPRPISLNATSVNEATVKQFELKVTFLDIPSVKAAAEVSGATKAYIAEGVTLDAKSLSVSADSTNEALINVFTIEFDAFTWESYKPTAKSTHSTEAYLGADLETAFSETLNGTLTLTTTAQVTATSSNTATIEKLAPFQTSFAAVRKFKPEVKVEGATVAFINGIFTVTAESLQLTADATNAATSRVVAVALSGFTFSDSNLKAVSAHNAEVFINASAILHAEDVAVTLDATSSTQVNAGSVSFKLSAIDVSLLTCEATVEGSTRAWIGEDASIFAGALELHADSNQKASAKPVLVSVSLINVNLVTAGAVSQHSTEANIGERAWIESNGVVRLKSTSVTEIEAVSGTYTGGFGYGSSTLFTQIDGPTESKVSENVTIEAASVLLQASTNSTATTSGKAFGAGAATGNAVEAEAEISSDVTAALQAAKVTTTGSVSIAATAVHIADASSGQASVAFAAGGGSVAKANIGGTVSASVDAPVDAGDALSVVAAADSQSTASSDGLTGGVVAIGVKNAAEANVTTLVQAWIGAFTITTVSDVFVAAVSKADAQADAYGLTTGAAVAIGTSQAIAKVDPQVEAFIAAPILHAGGAITVEALHNDNGTGPLDLGAVATATASGGGFLDISTGKGSEVTADASPIVTAKLGAASADITSGGATTIRARAHNEAVAVGKGTTVAVIGIGGIGAEAYANGSVRSSLEPGSILTSGGAFTLESHGDQEASAETVAAMYGLVNIEGNGTDAVAGVSPLIISSFGAGASVTAAGKATVAARAKTHGSSAAVGIAAGLVDIGSSHAITVVSPIVQAYLDASASLHTTSGDIIVLATHNLDDAGTTMATNADGSIKGAVVHATASSGALFGGNGASASASSSGNVDAIAGPNTTLWAATSLSILSRANRWVEADAKGDSSGLLGLTVVGLGTVEAVALTQGSQRAIADLNATLRAGSTLTLASQSFDNASANAAAASGGITVAGVHGADATATTYPFLDTHAGEGAHLSAGGDLVLDALSEANASATADGASTGVAGLEVGSSTATATVTPTIGALARLSTGLSTLGGLIQLQATHNINRTTGTAAKNADGTAKGAQAQATASGSTALIGTQGAHAFATDSGTVRAGADANTQLFSVDTVAVTRGDIRVVAVSSHCAEASADGDASGFVGIGSAEAEATVGGQTEAYLDGTVFEAARLWVEGRTLSLGRTNAQASRGGVISGSGATASTVVTPEVNARIGDDASVITQGDIVLLALSESDSDAVAEGASVRSAASVGKSRAAAELNPKIASWIGSRAGLLARDSSITVGAASNYSFNASTLDGAVLTGANDYATGSTGPYGAHAKATASSGGAFVYDDNDPTATATSDPDVSARAETASDLQAQNQGLRLVARSHSDADARATGNSSGGIATGKVTATADAEGAVDSRLIEVDYVQTGQGGLIVVGQGTNNANAVADGMSAGVVDGAGTRTATADAAHHVEASVSGGFMGGINSGSQTLIRGLARGSAQAYAEGLSSGAIEKSSSYASATWSPSVTASIGSGTILASRGEVKVIALQNYNDTGTSPVTTLTTSAGATAEGKGVFDKRTADARATVTASVAAFIGDSANVTAGLSSATDLSVLAKSNNQAKAEAVSKGHTLADAVVFNLCQAYTGDGVSLTAGRDIIICAESSNDTTATTTGPSGKAVSIDPITSWTSSRTGAGNTLTPGTAGSGSVVICAEAIEIVGVSTAATSVAESAGAGGSLALAGVDDADTTPIGTATADITVNVLTEATVGPGTIIHADRFELSASVHDSALTVQSHAPSQPGHPSIVHAALNAQVTARVHVAAGAIINADDEAILSARQDNVRAAVEAVVDSGNNTGAVASANNRLLTRTQVQTDPGSFFNTRNLTVEALWPGAPEDYVQHASTIGPLQSNWILESVGSTTQVDTRLNSLGAISQQEGQPDLLDWVEHLQTDPRALLLGTENRSGEVAFNSTVASLPTTAPRLVIAASGTILERTPEVTVQTTGPTIVVADLINHSTQGFMIDAPQAALTGLAHFQFRDGWSRVDVINHSQRNLVLGAIDVLNPAKPLPDLRLVTRDPTGFTSVFDTTGLAAAVVSILNDSPAGGDIILNGLIHAPLGQTILQSVKGNIRAGNSTATVQSRQIDLVASQGSIGADGAGAIALQLIESPAAGPTSLAQAIGRGGVFLSVTPRSAHSSTTNIAIGLIQAAAGTVDVALLSTTTRANYTVNSILARDAVRLRGEHCGLRLVGSMACDAGDIAVTVTDSIEAGDDFVLGENAALSAPEGSVTVLAGDNIDAALTSFLETGGSVRLQVDFGGQTDPGVGGILDWRGRLWGDEIEVLASNEQGDNDRIRVAGPWRVAARLNVQTFDGSDEILLSAPDSTAGLNPNRIEVRLDGGEGDDYLRSEFDAPAGMMARYWLLGRGGRDTLMGGNVAEILVGGLGDDYLDGGGQDDVLVGDEVDPAQPIVWSDTGLSIRGISGGGRDLMAGGNGRDVLLGAGGDDLLVGGRLESTPLGDTSDGGDFLDGGVGQDRLYGDHALASFTLPVAGAPFPAEFGLVTPVFSTRPNILYGGNGNDQLFGVRNRDTLDGGHWLGPVAGLSGQPYDVHLLVGATDQPRLDPATLPPFGSISGFVVTANSAGVEGTRVNLIYRGASDVLLDSQLTDGTGSYRFNSVGAGNYFLQIVPPTAYDIASGGVDPTNGRGDNFTLAAGQVVMRSNVVLNAAISSTFAFEQSFYSVAESDSAVQITIVRASGVTLTSVIFAVVGGTATGGEDYAASARFGRPTFTGDRVTLTIPLVNDSTAEGDETLRLALYLPTGLPLPGTRGTVVITLSERNRWEESDRIELSEGGGAGGAPENLEEIPGGALAAVGESPDPIAGGAKVVAAIGASPTDTPAARLPNGTADSRGAQPAMAPKFSPVAPRVNEGRGMILNSHAGPRDEWGLFINGVSSSTHKPTDDRCLTLLSAEELIEGHLGRGRYDRAGARDHVFGKR